MSTEYPIISIITSNFKQGEFIEKTIKSVLSQKGDFYIDYIVFDAKSPDKSWEIINKIQQELQLGEVVFEKAECKFYRVLSGCKGVSMRSFCEPDKGQYDGINKGLNIMIGDIWGYLNADDLLEPDALSSVAAFFNKNSEVGMLYGNGLYINEKDEIIGIYPSYDIANTDLLENCFVSQPSAFLRSEVFKKLGGFNIKIRNSADYEYWLRVQKFGFKIMHVRNILSSTRLHKQTKTNVNRVGIRDEILALTQHYGGYLPKRWRREFSREQFFLARIFDLIGQIFYKLRSVTAVLYSKVYGWRLKDVAKKEEERIFS